MPFEIVRNDITNMKVDAIVNTANPHPVVDSGTDAMIHQKAGPALLAARQKLGDIARGDAVITPAFGLDAQYVIHTVGPYWQGGSQNEELLLRSCYDKALHLALDNGCHSIAFPLISTGNYGFPKDKALQIAVAAFSAFLSEHELAIYLVVFDQKAFHLSEKLFRQVASYIDQNFVDACEQAAEKYNRRMLRNLAAESQCEYSRTERALPPRKAASRPKSASLEDMLRQADAGFSDRLLQLIDEAGKKDSEVYKKALLSKQHFSKIRNNPNYKPTKPTAIALALALELDLHGTQDLIGRAGYTLSNSSKFDLIIRYFIETRNYNIVEINVALYEFDQCLLGN